MSSSRRPSSRSRRPTRRAAAPAPNNSAAIMVGVGVVVLAIVAIMVMSPGSGNGDAQASGRTPAANPADNTPSAGAKPAADRGTPAKAASSGSPKAGKTPDRPAPPLDSELLTASEAKLRQATDAFNAAQRAHKAEDQATFETERDRTLKTLDELMEMLDGPVTWQADAEFEDWAQPAEYAALAPLWAKVAKLNKKARAFGG